LIILFYLYFQNIFPVLSITHRIINYCRYQESPDRKMFTRLTGSSVVQFAAKKWPNYQ